ncbi:MAG: hypothetical protein WBF33_33765 [Candidatus Nitrosopolaris sp.]|jgi:hypothetical protein
MRYAEELVTENKGDPVHSNTVSFGNCMIRIPGSYNSKYVQLDKDKGEVVAVTPQSEVKIVQRWDGYRPNIRWLLKDYWLYRIQERNNEVLRRLHNEQKRLRFERKYPNRISDIHQHSWIESLYARPLDDFRKYCITFVFTPYFINVKRLPHSDAFNLIKHWLDRCSSECRHLDFNARQRINEAFNRVGNYRPVSRGKLKEENNALHLRLEREGVIYR